MVLQLPGGKELKFTDDDKVRKNFWNKAAAYIDSARAPVVCVRQDTGVAEDVRNHVDNDKYSTYLLFHLLLDKIEATDINSIYNKASEIIRMANYEAMIDENSHFQLVVVDYLDADSFKADMHA